MLVALDGLNTSMLKKILLLISCVAMMQDLVGAAHERIVLVPNPVGFRCAAEQKHFEHMQAWVCSDDAQNLKQERSIQVYDGAFAEFLNVFVTHSRVKDLLDRRVHINFMGRTLSKDLVGLMITEEEHERIKKWYAEFKELLSVLGATFYENPSHAEPGTAVFSFSEFPQYVLKFRAWNVYPLGCYDAHGSYSCLVSGVRMSGYPFPVQVVSRILYSQEIKKFLEENAITNIRAPEKWLYVLPWALGLPLNDQHIFVVAEKIEFEKENQKRFLLSLKEPGEEISKEALLQKAADQSNTSILANMVRVMMSVGLFDICAGADNFVLCRQSQNSENLILIFIDTDRPAFGGGDPLCFFHKKDGESAISPEVISNGLVGVGALVDLFKDEHAPDVVVQPEGVDA